MWAFLLQMFIISNYVLILVLLIKRKRYPEDTWNEIEKYHGYSFEPYLTTKSINSGIPNCQPTNEKFRESLELKSDEEPDFTIERYFYYDGFIKSLQVMSILNIVFLKSADILKVSSKIFIILIYQLL